MLNLYEFDRIIILIIIILFIILLIKSQKKYNKELDDFVKNNPKYKEKARIDKSKSIFVKGEIFTPTLKKYYIAIITLIIALICTFYFDIPLINPEIEKHIPAILVVVTIALLILATKATAHEATEFAQTALNIKYGQVLDLNIPEKKVIYKDKSEVGNICEVCKFSCYINKYNCKVENFQHEKLIRKIYKRRYTYKYVKIKNIFKYTYTLNNHEILNNPNAILQNPKVNEVIQELSDIKLIKVSIINNQLIIEKETVLHGYNKTDAECDVNDVELFYNKLVKIIEEVYNNELCNV